MKSMSAMFHCINQLSYLLKKVCNIKIFPLLPSIERSKFRNDNVHQNLHSIPLMNINFSLQKRGKLVKKSNDDRLTEIVYLDENKYS